MTQIISACRGLKLSSRVLIASGTAARKPAWQARNGWSLSRWDQQFESAFLQRRVNNEPWARGSYHPLTRIRRSSWPDEERRVCAELTVWENLDIADKVADQLK